MNVIEITCSDDCEPPPWRASFHAVVESILARMRLVKVEISILFCGVETMRLLNARFRGNDAPTDVLTFPQYEYGYDYGHTLDTVRPCDTNSLGDIVISLPIALQQALQNVWTELEECVYLTIHGLLHIVGFDHAVEGEADTDCMLVTQQWMYRNMQEYLHTYI